jgi:hypothetical protein
MDPIIENDDTFAEMIQGSDFGPQELDCLQPNGKPFDLTGLSAATIALKGKTVSTVVNSALGAELAISGDPKLGALAWTMLNAKTSLVATCDPKDIDVVTTGPWGVKTFRFKLALAVRAPAS